MRAVILVSWMRLNHTCLSNVITLCRSVQLQQQSPYKLQRVASPDAFHLHLGIYLTH